MAHSSAGVEAAVIRPGSHNTNGRTATNLSSYRPLPPPPHTPPPLPSTPIPTPSPPCPHLLTTSTPTFPRPQPDLPNNRSPTTHVPTSPLQATSSSSMVEDENPYCVVTRVFPKQEEDGEGEGECSEGSWEGRGCKEWGFTKGWCQCLMVALVISALLNGGLLAFTMRRLLDVSTLPPPQHPITTPKVTLSEEIPIATKAPVCVPCVLLAEREGEGEGQTDGGTGLTSFDPRGNFPRLCCRQQASHIATLLSMLVRSGMEREERTLPVSPSHKITPSPSPSTCSGVRPAAHLMALPKGDSLQWEVDKYNAGFTQCLDINSDEITILQEGLYYVYSHFTLKPPGTVTGAPPQSPSVHSLVRIDVTGKSSVLLSTSTDFKGQSSAAILESSVLAGRLRLHPGDKLRVRLDEAVLLDHNITRFFGLYKVE